MRTYFRTQHAQRLESSSTPTHYLSAPLSEFLSDHRRPTDHDALLDLSQLLLRSRQLGVGLLQGQSLRLHLAVHLVELDDVDDPRAQTLTTKAQHIIYDIHNVKSQLQKATYSMHTTKS